ncbi:class I SAM-dependent methyltransferase [Angustibacter sp. McL0619]|uniref:class I SAM-dependent methyltransferase n=1 Tax=Angustibacter sp. McL0619 TaxID=3415676 RepID=UPI003CEC8477
MTRPSFDDRRLSFGAAAARYERFRPPFPADAVRWVLDGATRPVEDVADVGAGTGKLTRSLVEVAPRVTAFEPDAGMLAELALRVPQAARQQARAEALPVADHTFDAVTVAQAWHWFDRAAAAAEFRRVLRPGGVIALVWNIRDDHVPWMADLSKLLESDERPTSIGEITEILPTAERAEFTHTVPMAADDVIGLLSTISYVRLRPDADEVYAAAQDLLASHPDTRGRDVLDVPYVTSTFRIPVP